MSDHRCAQRRLAAELFVQGPLVPHVEGGGPAPTRPWHRADDAGPRRSPTSRRSSDRHAAPPFALFVQSATPIALSPGQTFPVNGSASGCCEEDGLSSSRGGGDRAVPYPSTASPSAVAPRGHGAPRGCFYSSCLLLCPALTTPVLATGTPSARLVWRQRFFGAERMKGTTAFGAPSSPDDTMLAAGRGRPARSPAGSAFLAGKYNNPGWLRTSWCRKVLGREAERTSEGY